MANASVKRQEPLREHDIEEASHTKDAGGRANRCEAAPGQATVL
ncbi:MAG TPA: hypothetical protein VGJ16_00655 [Pirellulales bacterium]